MRVQNINQNNYTNKQNFGAGKYLSGAFDNIVAATEKLDLKHCGKKHPYLVDNYLKPVFELRFVALDESHIFIATEDTVLTVDKIIQKAKEKGMKQGEEFSNFFKRKISEYLKIDFKPQESTEMLTEMENPAYDYAKMAVKN